MSARGRRPRAWQQEEPLQTPRVRGWVDSSLRSLCTRLPSPWSAPQPPTPTAEPFPPVGLDSSLHLKAATGKQPCRSVPSGTPRGARGLSGSGGGAFKVGVREGHCASHLVPIGNKEYITPRDPTAFLAPCNLSLFISRLSHRGCFQETLNFLWAGSMQQELTDAERTGISTLD